MFSFIKVGLLLVIGITTLPFEETHTLQPYKEHTYRLEHLKEGNLTVQVVGDNKGGDVDCYLIIKGHIIAKEESDADRCALGMIRASNDPDIIVWIINDGNKPDTYSIKISQ
jgi:hypothetical protein